MVFQLYKTATSVSMKTLRSSGEFSLKLSLAYPGGNGQEYITDTCKGGFRGGARGAEAPPSRFIAPLSKVLQLEALAVTSHVLQHGDDGRGGHGSSSSYKKVR